MPREDVPYPGAAICSIKERLEEIADEVDQKLETINGVHGGGSGNVNIVPATPGLAIDTDPVHHLVKLRLVTGDLPAAAVDSVNGQTGTVVLDGTDIQVGSGYVNATAAISALKTQATQTANNLLTETTNRQNADAALQSNINAALATIPSEAAQAVANDATVQQLSSDVTALQAADAGNVKLAGSQTITGIKKVPTQGTGSYDQQIASSQKVKNELDAYSPMVRTTGNQLILGDKRADMVTYRGFVAGSSDSGYSEILNLGSSGTTVTVTLTEASRFGCAVGVIRFDGTSVIEWSGVNLPGNISIGIGIKSNVMYLCMKRTSPAGAGPSITIHNVGKGTNAAYVTPIAAGISATVEDMDSYYQAVIG